MFLCISENKNIEICSNLKTFLKAMNAYLHFKAIVVSVYNYCCKTGVSKRESLTGYGLLTSKKISQMLFFRKVTKPLIEKKKKISVMGKFKAFLFLVYVFENK